MPWRQAESLYLTGPDGRLDGFAGLHLVWSAAPPHDYSVRLFRDGEIDHGAEGLANADPSLDLLNPTFSNRQLPAFSLIPHKAWDSQKVGQDQHEI
jgi:hypothetical protein